MEVAVVAQSEFLALGQLYVEFRLLPFRHLLRHLFLFRLMRIVRIDAEVFPVVQLFVRQAHLDEVDARQFEVEFLLSQFLRQCGNAFVGVVGPRDGDVAREAQLHLCVLSRAVLLVDGLDEEVGLVFLQVE